MQLSEAKDLPKLVKTAVRFMINDCQAERALVVVDPSGSRQPEALAQYGFESTAIWSDSSLPLEVLRKAMEHQQSSFLLDAHRETASKSCARSVVCAALGRGFKFRGFLYCDHPVAGTLGHGVKNKMGQLAQDFDERYQALLREARSPATEGPAPLERDYEAEAGVVVQRLRWSVTMVAVVLVLLLAASL